MKYTGLPMGLWVLFSKSFQQKLVTTFHIDEQTAKKVTKKSKEKYRKILMGIPEFEKGDRFKMNIVSCAMLSSFLINMPA